MKNTFKQNKKKEEKLEAKMELSFQNVENVSIHSQYLNYIFPFLYSLTLSINQNMENKSLLQFYGYCLSNARSQEMLLYKSCFKYLKSDVIEYRSVHIYVVWLLKNK